MEGSQYSPPVDPRGMDRVTPISVADFLYSLARTPTTTRFNRRRQRLLEGKPRLSRVRRVVRDADRSTTVRVGSPQHDQAHRDAMISAEARLDAEGCQRPSNNEPDIFTVGQTIRMTRLALLDPAIDVNNREANEVTDGKDIDAAHFSKQLPFTSDKSPLYGQHRYQENIGDSSMFVSAHSM